MRRYVTATQGPEHVYFMFWHADSAEHALEQAEDAKDDFEHVLGVGRVLPEHDAPIPREVHESIEALVDYATDAREARDYEENPCDGHVFEHGRRVASWLAGADVWPIDRDDWPTHQPRAYDAPIPGTHWYSGCDPDRPRVDPASCRCESCGEIACGVCGRERCPDHTYFAVGGWIEGEDVEPPEPGKQWLSILENGEELAVIVHRDTDHDDNDRWREQKEQRAERIVSALNAAVHNGTWST